MKYFEKSLNELSHNEKSLNELSHNEKSLNELSLNDLTQCDIYINDSIQNGYGLMIDEYVLTLNHIILNHNILINRKQYDILYVIDEYDICILCDHNYKGDIHNFLSKIESKIYRNDIDILHINEINKYMKNKFKIYKSNIILNFVNIEQTSLKSNILPQILIGKFTSSYNGELNGYSGSICYVLNKIFGILVSQTDEHIEILPLEFIIDLIKIIVQFGKRYLPISLSSNKIINNYKQFQKNDEIISINDNDLNDSGMIYCHKYNIFVPIDTYILMHNNHKINFKLFRQTHKYKKEITIKYLIEKINENNISLNIKENNKYYNIKNLLFKELSEEYLINICGIKKIPQIDYNNIFTKKKILYLDSDLDNKINRTEEVLILNKISGHKIFNLNQIKHYTNQKNCVFEFIDTNNNFIKYYIN